MAVKDNASTGSRERCVCHCGVFDGNVKSGAVCLKLRDPKKNKKKAPTSLFSVECDRSGLNKILR